LGWTKNEMSEGIENTMIYTTLRIVIKARWIASTSEWWVNFEWLAEVWHLPVEKENRWLQF
jgi:hypothetical protein